VDEVAWRHAIQQGLGHLGVLLEQALSESGLLFAPVEDLERARLEEFTPLPQPKLVETFEVPASPVRRRLPFALRDKAAKLVRAKAGVGSRDVNESPFVTTPQPEEWIDRVAQEAARPNHARHLGERPLDRGDVLERRA
jgi:hypothetical protein